MARARKAAQKKSKGSQLDAIKNAQTLTCKTCYSSFMCTATQGVLQQHIDAKHSGATFAQCFPDFDPNAAKAAKKKKKNGGGGGGTKNPNAGKKAKGKRKK